MNLVRVVVFEWFCTDRVIVADEGTGVVIYPVLSPSVCVCVGLYM